MADAAIVPKRVRWGRDELRSHLLLHIVQRVDGKMEEVLVQAAFTTHVALLLSGEAHPCLARAHECTYYFSCEVWMS